MKKVKIKIKFILSGFAPFTKNKKPFSIDGYVLKSETYDEKGFNNIKDIKVNRLLYSNKSLINILYSTDNVYNNYLYFESRDYIEYEVGNNNYNNKDKLIKYIMNKVQSSKCDEFLEKKLRLIFNMHTTITEIIVDIFDAEKKFIKDFAIVKNKFYETNRYYYKNNIHKRSENRGRFHFNTKLFKEFCIENKEFDKALTMYNESFNNSNKSVSFILLITSLECLFNIDKNDVKKTVTNYVSKIMYGNEDKKSIIEKMGNYYNRRSDYIHGRKLIKFGIEEIDELREIVREVLLIYWQLQNYYSFKSHKEVLNFINSQKKLSRSMELIVKAFKINSDYEMKKFIEDNKGRY